MKDKSLSNLVFFVLYSLLINCSYVRRSRKKSQPAKSYKQTPFEEFSSRQPLNTKPYGHNPYVKAEINTPICTIKIQFSFCEMSIVRIKDVYVIFQLSKLMESF